MRDEEIDHGDAEQGGLGGLGDLHFWLDGSMGPAETVAFNRRLVGDPLLRRRMEALRGMEGWLGETRSVAPPELAAAIAAAVRVDAARGEWTARRGRPSWWRRFLSVAKVSPIESPSRSSGRPKDFAWVPAALALAAVVLLVVRVVVDEPRVLPAAPVEIATSSSGPIRWEFSFAAGPAHQVCLVGSFNGWAVCRTPLRPAGDGTWEVSVELPPGRHEYMFVVDGRWESDPDASQRVDDGFGHMNAVLLL
jgi:hypothetical protein